MAGGRSSTHCTLLIEAHSVTAVAVAPSENTSQEQSSGQSLHAELALPVLRPLLPIALR